MMRAIASKARQRIEESCSKRAFATFRKKSTLTEVVVLVSDPKSSEIPSEVLDKKSHDCVAEKACDLTFSRDDVGNVDTFRHYVLTDFTRVEHVGLPRQCSYKVCFGSECFDIVSPRSLFGPRWMTPQEHEEQCACATKDIRCLATLMTFRFNWDK
ncbi:Hypp8085 [Branchiostoma lanceolatum]|uniref:Hypp8085 protein n=1 Tax=Branchiostoma lanceolatum TaxID=7740 RepID=A0A8J9Z6L4_BRALA|nr:Hypp8085 [Branchiostoma lanceolatum]